MDIYGLHISLFLLLTVIVCPWFGARDTAPARQVYVYQELYVRCTKFFESFSRARALHRKFLSVYSHVTNVVTREKLSRLVNHGGVYL